MKRKKILYIQQETPLGRLDPKFMELLPYIKKHYNTYITNIRNPVARSSFDGKIIRLPAKAVARLVLKSVKYDLVYVRNILDVTLLRGLRLMNHNLVLEISQPGGSALDLFPRSTEKSSRRIRKNVEKAAKVAKIVLVEGEHQAKLLRKWNNNILVCPPVFPHPTAPFNNPGPGEEVRAVGFAGTGDTCQALKSLERGLQEVCRRFPRIHAIGKSDSLFILEPPVKYMYKKIDFATSSDIFSDMDIFIFPATRQTDDFYGNSLFVLLALAAKKPCVVWSTEIDGNIFQNGEDLFIVSNDDEFVEKLSTLIENRELRFTMAQRGFEKAQKYFSPEVVSDFYIDAFNKSLETN